jgi:hypothetical protein
MIPPASAFHPRQYINSRLVFTIDPIPFHRYGNFLFYRLLLSFTFITYFFLLPYSLCILFCLLFHTLRSRPVTVNLLPDISPHYFCHRYKTDHDTVHHFQHYICFYAIFYTQFIFTLDISICWLSYLH